MRTGEIKADHPEIEVSGNRVKSIGRKDSDRASIELEVDVLELSAQMNSSWREPKRGDEGELVKAAQLLLKSAAHSVTADGEFGDDTVTAVKAFQKAQGISKSGIVDKETWKKLFKTGKEGDSGEVVRAIQHTLRFWGYPLVADGKFGAGTKEAVKEFQFATDLEEDGIVGPNTWSRLISFDRYFPREIVGSAHEIRCDSVGLGHYQAPRGSHKHAGIDVLAPKDTVVMSPFDAKVIRKAKPHADDDTLSGIYIQGKQDTDWKDFHVKMFYLKPTIAIPSGCDAGSKLGVMQRLLDSPKYNDDRMKNHIHIEVEYKGRKVNPALFTRQYAILCSE